MDSNSRKKVTFMAKQDNYQYNVMLFGLKYPSVIYQRMMNKVFREEI